MKLLIFSSLLKVPKWILACLFASTADKDALPPEPWSKMDFELQFYACFFRLNALFFMENRKFDFKQGIYSASSHNMTFLEQFFAEWPTKLDKNISES